MIRDVQCVFLFPFLSHRMKKTAFATLALGVLLVGCQGSVTDDDATNGSSSSSSSSEMSSESSASSDAATGAVLDAQTSASIEIEAATSSADAE
jgi:hypothetical protein